MARLQHDGDPTVLGEHRLGVQRHPASVDGAGAHPCVGGRDLASGEPRAELCDPQQRGVPVDAAGWRQQLEPGGAGRRDRRDRAVGVDLHDARTVGRVTQRRRRHGHPADACGDQRGHRLQQARLAVIEVGRAALALELDRGPGARAVGAGDPQLVARSRSVASDRRTGGCDGHDPRPASRRAARPGASSRNLWTSSTASSFWNHGVHVSASNASMWPWLNSTVAGSVASHAAAACGTARRTATAAPSSTSRTSSASADDRRTASTVAAALAVPTICVPCSPSDARHGTVAAAVVPVLPGPASVAVPDVVPHPPIGGCAPAPRSGRAA